MTRPLLGWRAVWRWHGRMGKSLLGISDQSSLKKRLNQVAAGFLTVLVLFVVFFTFKMANLDQFVEQLELKTYDLRAQMGWWEPTRRPSPDVVILQFDDPSLNVLNDEFGLWPWPRDVHARMIDFLNRAGVNMMLYDIMFVSYRKGDEASDTMLSDAFHRYDNVYLSMNFDNELLESQKLGKDLKPQDIERLKPLSITVHSELDSSSVSDRLRLKRDERRRQFFDNPHMTFNHYRSIMPSLLDKGSNIGIINHGADMDGVSRSNPLFFRLKYQPFIQTVHYPLRLESGAHYDAQGHKVDAQGYLYARSEYPVRLETCTADGLCQDANPNYRQPVDREGYLMDGYGNYIYQRQRDWAFMHFPYLGLRALLDLKYPKKTPELTIGADGHLRFEGYNIPLSDKGDFLLSWHNVNVTRDEYKQNQRELLAFRQNLQTQISSLEQRIRQLDAGTSTEREALQSELQAKQTDFQKSGLMLELLAQALSADYFPQPYRTVSAWEVIRTMKKEEAGLPLAPEDEALKKLLRDKIVFIGATAVAAYDIKNTSIHATMPGVILQANLFDNLYQNTGQYLRRVEPKVNLLITTLICLIAAGFTFKMRSALAGMLTSANLAVFYILGAILLYQYANLWINIAMPLVALILTTMVTFMVKYILRDKDYEKTYAMATTDSMTGLYNHRFFQEHMRRSVDQAVRFKHKFSLVLIDIDFFKKFNDTYGHQAGDEVLRAVAEKLKKNVRTVDVVARYGGEEMAVILDRASEEEALAVAGKLVKAIAEEAYPIAEGVAKHVTISCGVATFPSHGETPPELIEFADQGLYRAKENGRNQVGAQYDDGRPPASDASPAHAPADADEDGGAA